MSCVIGIGRHIGAVFGSGRGMSWRRCGYCCGRRTARFLTVQTATTDAATACGAIVVSTTIIAPNGFCFASSIAHLLFFLALSQKPGIHTIGIQIAGRSMQSFTFLLGFPHGGQKGFGFFGGRQGCHAH